MTDIVIRNGTIVDGTGAPGRVGDVAIEGDRIVAVGQVEERGDREIDASGRMVTPGFVDIHTHLDAQIAWDPAASSSCFHGITSVVLGNCGVTFAPCKPTDRAYLAEMMESVEDIPAKSILAGLPWNWETYGEYLKAIDAMPKGVNVGGMVGHCAVRYHAMGERSLDEAPAGEDDVRKICALVDEAIGAGALGFSTSRTYMHKVPDGRPVPGTFAATEEMLAIGRVMGRHGKGVFEAAARLGERDNDALDNTRREVAWMGQLSRENRIKVTFGLTHSYRRPDLYRRVIEFADEENASGAHLRPQTTSRGVGVLFALDHITPWHQAPAWRELAAKPFAERLAALEDAALRQRLIADAEAQPATLDLNQSYLLLDGHVHYAHQAENSLAGCAARHGQSPVEAFIELNRAHQGRVVVYYAALNQSMDAIEEMLRHPTVVMGLADSGAHVGQIMDASSPTWLLSYWVRERGVLTVEEAIRGWTSETAELFGIRDRGVLRPGAFADVNVIDLDRLSLGLPEYRNDFPEGAGRYVQTATGYDCTIVNGRVQRTGFTGRIFTYDVRPSAAGEFRAGPVTLALPDRTLSAPGPVLKVLELEAQDEVRIRIASSRESVLV
ncbi:MAG: N-acyl-D-amino-acid deacylase family protein, partial [Anaerolineae bacterium]